MSLFCWHILALFITLLAELIIVWVLTRKNIFGLLFYLALINSFTLPIATFFYQKSGKFFLVELAVFLSEGFLLKLLLEIRYARAYLISFVANFATALISLLFFR